MNNVIRQQRSLNLFFGCLTWENYLLFKYNLHHLRCVQLATLLFECQTVREKIISWRQVMSGRFQNPNRTKVLILGTRYDNCVAYKTFLKVSLKNSSTGTAYPARATEFPTFFWWGPCWLLFYFSVLYLYSSYVLQFQISRLPIWYLLSVWWSLC